MIKSLERCRERFRIQNPKFIVLLHVVCGTLTRRTKDGFSNNWATPRPFVVGHVSAQSKEPKFLRIASSAISYFLVKMQALMMQNIDWKTFPNY